MMRALYSGVAGLKTHMTRLDVIGNNIANVNTYGYKSSRATFRDMFYQQVRGASVGTNTRGGINPSAIGYGSQLSSIDLLMGQSGMTNTGNSLDVAITGEGFLQVQDPDGNIYYTKAGMLDIDTNGRLVDTNGNFVLGTSATSGQLNSTEPGRSIIQITVDPVEPAYATLETTVLGNALKITSNAQTNLGNVSFTFSSSQKTASGEEFLADEPLEVIMENGSSNIAVRLNEKFRFTDMAQLGSEINAAIKKVNGGDYEGGEFTFELTDEQGNDLIKKLAAQIGKDGLTGGDIAVSKDNSLPPEFTAGAVSPGAGITIGERIGTDFPGGVDITALTYAPKTVAPATTVNAVDVTLTAGGKTYKGTLDAEHMLVRLTPDPATTAEDYISIGVDSAANLQKLLDAGTQTLLAGTIGKVTPATPSTSLGLGKQTWTLEGGTEGGAQSYENLTGISIGADGKIVGSHPVHGRLVLGRIDLANFANPMGLAQSGNTYFSETENSGKANFAVPGEDGTGAIKNSTLEMSNVDLAQEFSDMIITQRGYQANSRIITVSDTVLEELINLKR